MIETLKKPRDSPGVSISDTAEKLFLSTMNMQVQDSAAWTSLTVRMDSIELFVNTPVCGQRKGIKDVTGYMKDGIIRITEI